MRKRSSWCALSADQPLNRLEQWYWFASNWLDNHWRPNLGTLEERRFTLPFTQENWELLDQITSSCNSPSRRLIHLFLLALPWQSLTQELGRIRMVDIGCGKGLAGVQLQTLSGGRIARYTGFDLKPSPLWSTLAAQHAYMNFAPLTGAQIPSRLPEATNLIFSQTALEHIPDDLELLQKLQQHPQQLQNPALHLHFIPSPACLSFYGLHGFRQYSKRKAAVIAQIFAESHHATLFALGGSACERLHAEYRVLARELSALGEERQKGYNQRLRQAIQADFQTPSLPVNFYALMLRPKALRPVMTVL